MIRNYPEVVASGGKVTYDQEKKLFLWERAAHVELVQDRTDCVLSSLAEASLAEQMKQVCDDM